MFYEALGSDVGVVIDTNDPEKVRQKLYSLRREAQDPALDCISIVASPSNPLQLWLIKKPTEAESET